MSQGFYGFPNILGLLRATSIKILGKPGATSGLGLAGGTVSGAPTTGQFDSGDIVVDASGALFVCTASGSPGTWVLANDPTTAEGDLIYRHSGTLARLAVGAVAGYALLSTATDPAWADAVAGGPTRYEPLCDVVGSVVVNAAGDPVMALAGNS